MVGIERNSDTGTDRDFDLINTNRLGDRGYQAVGNSIGDTYLRQTRQDNYEFVAANTRDGIGFADFRGDACGALTQHTIAKFMAIAVVDFLETIKIEKHDCGSLVISPRLSQRLVETILAQTQTGQSGKRIVVGQKMQFGGYFLTLLDLDLQLFDRIGEFTGTLNHLLLERITRADNFLLGAFLCRNILQHADSLLGDAVADQVGFTHFADPANFAIRPIQAVLNLPFGTLRQKPVIDSLHNFNVVRVHKFHAAYTLKITMNQILDMLAENARKPRACEQVLLPNFIINKMADIGNCLGLVGQGILVH